MSKTIYNKENKYHYTYLITELSSGRMYIGVRSSNTKPSDDIGINYFSSSYDHEFMNNQKSNPSDYTYEVLNEFSTREDAIDNEIYLHKLYNVSRSSDYINRANSTYSGFDMYGRIVVRDENGDTMIINTDDPRYLSGELQHHSKGHVDRELSSITMKNRWKDKNLMMETCQNTKSLEKRSNSKKEWIKNNPEAHQERMLKINKNPEKIAKMAEKHRGMKRSEDACINISEAKKAAFANKSDEQIAATVGRGMVYMTNLITYEAKRVPSDYQLKDYESFGVIKNPKEPLKKRAVVTNIDTWEEYWCEAGYVLKDNERKGNRKVVKKKLSE